MPIGLFKLINIKKCSKPALNKAQNSTIWVLINPLKLSYKAPELHGSFETELRDSLETELQGS